MTLQELNRLTPQELIDAIKEQKGDTRYEEGIKQFKVEEHAVKKLPKKPTSVAVEGKFKDDGVTPLTETKWVDVTRIALPLQKFIITQRASFAVGNKITFKPDVQESPVFEAAWETWRRSKMQYLLKEIAIRLMSETEVALIWYGKADEKSPGKLKLRTKIISPELGDALFPYFDNYNDLIAFGREYEIDDVPYFDLYTAETLRRYKEMNGVYEEQFKEVDAEGNGIVEKLNYGKLPIIYWSQEYPECHDVADVIAALEKSFSKFMDDNAYFGQPPLMFAADEVSMMPGRDDAGKVFRVSKGGTAGFLTGGNTIGSREYEFNRLLTDIFTFTRAARLDAESMKGLGDLSAAAMDRMLISPHMAARDMQDGEFGMGIQRCMNFLIAVYSDILGIQDKVEAEPQFSLFRIDDAAERIELAMKANGNKPVLDQEESIRMAGVSDYPEEAFKKLQEEARANIQNATQGMQGNGSTEEEEEDE